MLTLDDNLAIGFTAGPRYSSSIIPLSGGKERRNQAWPLPRRAYEFGYAMRDIEDCHAIEDFFHDVNGQNDVWLMPDFTLASDKVHNLGTGNGSANTFQARYGYGSTSIRYVSVSAVVAGSYTVFVNGTPVTVSSELNGLFTLASPPSNGAVVTATFTPLIPVRFEQDDLRIQVEGPGGRYGRIANLSAIEVR